MMLEAIERLVTGRSLTRDEAFGAMADIMAARATPVQIASFLVALRMKGETALEIAGCALAMREAAQKISLSSKVIVDTCGTGGDGSGSFNISTAAALVVSGAGYTVAKHGNRSISSRSGSADVLERLGVDIQAPPEMMRRSLEECGIGFLFAPLFHPAMKHAMPVRKELGLRTVFNLLGPLVNPAQANVQVIGVYDLKLVKIMAEVLKALKTSTGFIVHDHGYDEITLGGDAAVAQVYPGGRIEYRRLNPRHFGLKKQSKKVLQGSSPQENALLLERLLKGEKHPLRNVVAANAALALQAAALASQKSGAKTLRDAVTQAFQSIDSGKAFEKLEELKARSHGE